MTQKAKSQDARHRSGIECTIDIQRLECIRPVAIVLRHPEHRRALHGLQDFAAQRSAADRIECDWRSCLLDRIGKVPGKVLVPAVDDMGRADAAQDGGLLFRPHDIDSGMPSARQIFWSIWPGFEAAAV